MLDEIKVLQKEVDAFTPKNKKELELLKGLVIVGVPL